MDYFKQIYSIWYLILFLNSINNYQCLKTKINWFHHLLRIDYKNRFLDLRNMSKIKDYLLYKHNLFLNKILYKVYLQTCNSLHIKDIHCFTSLFYLKDQHLLTNLQTCNFMDLFLLKSLIIKILKWILSYCLFKKFSYFTSIQIKYCFDKLENQKIQTALD